MTRILTKVGIIPSASQDILFKLVEATSVLEDAAVPFHPIVTSLTQNIEKYSIGTGALAHNVWAQHCAKINLSHLLHGVHIPPLLAYQWAYLNAS